MEKVKIFLILLICSYGHVYGQNHKIDSLFNTYKNTNDDSTRCRLSISIGKQSENQLPDTAIQWYNRTISIAAKPINRDEIFTFYTAISLEFIGEIESKYKHNYDSSIQYLSKSLGLLEGLISKSSNKEMVNRAKVRLSYCYNSISLVYLNRSDFDLSIEFILKALKINQELGNKSSMSNNYSNLGIVYKNQGKYVNAIENHLKAIKLREELGDEKGVASCYGNIGVIYYDQGNYDKAMEYYLMNLKVAEKLNDKIGIISCCVNIGLVYSNQSNYSKAIENYLKSLKISEEIDYKEGISACYNNIGIAYMNQGNNKEAIDYYLKSLKIDEQLGDKQGIAIDYGNISKLYIGLADSSKNQDYKNYLKDAIFYGKKSYNLALEIGALPMQNDAASHLQNAFKKLGNLFDAIKYAEIYIETQDSMFKDEKTRALAQMEAKYQNEKKQKEIELLNKDKELQKVELKRQTTQKYAFIIGFVLMLALAVISFRSYRQKKKANQLLTEKNERIEAQNVEIEAQRDLAAQQRDLIAEQKKDITDSINSAYRIQSAIIPPEDYLSGILNDYFILYKPRDIVSGDFYWMDKKDTKLIIIAVDCTGHGVPGAFMSMLGVAFLNEIVNKENSTSPAEILNKLRDVLIESLKQKGNFGETKEGMDVSAITIDLMPGNMNLQFAGANNPLYIISEAENESSQLVEVKGQKMPVGIYEKIEPFVNYETKIKSGDILYIFSDGYMDQFGGTEGKKFKYKPFKELLLKHKLKSMKEQKVILEQFFCEWKGNLDQTDDVLVIGLKI